MKQQGEIYKSEILNKVGEEQNLTQVLSEYRERFIDFDKSMKQSKKTLQQYEKEVNGLQRRVNELESQKRKVLNPVLENGKKKKKGKGKEVPLEKPEISHEEEITCMKAAW